MASFLSGIAFPKVGLERGVRCAKTRMGDQGEVCSWQLRMDEALTCAPEYLFSAPNLRGRRWRGLRAVFCSDPFAPNDL